MKKVLVLSYSDNPAEGHALSLYKAIKAAGYDAFFVSMVSEFIEDTPAYFIDFHKKWTLAYFSYKIRRKLRNIFSPVVKDTEEYCFFNSANFYVVDAKEILAKIPVTPEVIILGWIDYFVSPKVIYDLYHATHAKIVIPMVDPHILGGDCHYPCMCHQYENGCTSCPALKNGRSASNFYSEKMKYLQNIPFTIVGTSYDLKRAKKVPFLQGKEMIPTIGTPTVPFVKSKFEARKEFGIDASEFVILCGAFSLKDKRKGIIYLLSALELFCKNRDDKRPVTLLLLGDGTVDFACGDGIRIVTPGFLKLDQLFTAYYAADVFVSPSVDDSGPYMVNYSIACGTPVISFPVGVALDLVKHHETGYLAQFLDCNDMARGLMEFYEMSEQGNRTISDNCLNLMNQLQSDITPWFLKVLN